MRVPHLKSAGSGEALLLRGKLLFSLTVKRRAIADAIRQIECRKPLSGASDRPRFRGMTLLRGAPLRVFPPRGIPDCGTPLCTLRMLRCGNPCGRCACHGVTASRGIPLGIAAPRGSLPRGAPLRVVPFLGSFLLRVGPGFCGNLRHFFVFATFSGTAGALAVSRSHAEKSDLAISPVTPHTASAPDFPSAAPSVPPSERRRTWGVR